MLKDFVSSTKVLARTGCALTVAFLLTSNDASALGRRSKATATRVTATSQTTVTTATEKSTVQARTGRMGHVGRVPAGHFEGVGFSSRSAQEALDSCCYSRSGMAVVDQSVVRGANGWFATKLYRGAAAVASAPIRAFQFATGRGPTCSGAGCSK